MDKFNIIAALMAKNEEKRILVSLDSIKDSVSGVALYDTGSEDNTVKIVKDFCNKNNIEFFLLEGQFEDFSVSRNILFDFIDKINTSRLEKHPFKNKNLFDYVLLLDSNDEYKGKKPLPDILKEEIDTLDCKDSKVETPFSISHGDGETGTDATEVGASAALKSNRLSNSRLFEGNAHVRYKIKCRKTDKKNAHKKTKRTTGATTSGAEGQIVVKKPTPDAFMVKQRWFVGGGRNDLCYFNIKIVKPHIGFKYVEPVHEYLQEPPGCYTHKIIDGIEIYQDRVADNDGKSANRWKNDICVLSQVLQEKPEDARTQYYLAQTYECLENLKEARRYYKIRSENPHGFSEERFFSMLKCGYLKPSSSVGWFLKAYDFMARAEPLIELSRFFRNKNQFEFAFTFAKIACSLQFPETQTLLWSHYKMYNHDRWQELAINAYYVKQFEEGEEACKKALQSSYDKELNAKNLEFYNLHKKTECINGLQKP